MEKNCQPADNYLVIYENFRKIATGQRDDYIPGFLLYYNYFNNYYRIIATDLSKQQAIQKQYSKSILLQVQIEKETQRFSLLNKQKKPS